MKFCTVVLAGWILILGRAYAPENCPQCAKSDEPSRFSSVFTTKESCEAAQKEMWRSLRVTIQTLGETTMRCVGRSGKHRRRSKNKKQHPAKRLSSSRRNKSPRNWSR